MFFFNKIINEQTASYLKDILPKTKSSLRNLPSTRANIQNQNGIFVLLYYNSFLIHLFLYGNEYDSTSNKNIITFVIKYIINSKRFDSPLLWKKDM